MLENYKVSTLAELLKLKRKTDEQGDWVPACGGTSIPFYTRTRHHLIYCWQPATGRHAYLDLKSDLILSDEDAYAILSKH